MISRKKVSFRVSLTTLVLCIVLTLSALLIWNGQRESTRAAKIMANQLFNCTTEGLVQRTARMLDAATGLVGIGASATGLDSLVREGKTNPHVLNLLCDMLERYDYFYSIYFGYETGNFIQLIAMRGEGVRKKYHAPEGTAFVLRIVYTLRGRKQTRWILLDPDAQPILYRTSDNTTYDPRKRPWYQQAMNTEGVIFTSPYVFHSSGQPGITCAQKLDNKSGVFGVDFTLTYFSQFLRDQPVSPNGTVFFLNLKHQVMAHAKEPIVAEVTDDEGVEIGLQRTETFNDPVVREIGEDMKSPSFAYNTPLEREVAGEDYLLSVYNVGSRLGMELLIGVGSPLSDFTAHVSRMQQQNLYAALGLLLLVVPFVLYVSNRVSRSLTILGKEAEKVRQFDFSETEPVNSYILEIDSLSKAFDLMKTTLHEYMDELMDTQNKLQQLVDQGIMLSSEHDLERLMGLTLEAAQYLTNAEGGIVYIKEGEKLLVKHARYGRHGLALENSGEEEALSLHVASLQASDQGDLLYPVLFLGKTLVLENNERIRQAKLIELSELFMDVDVTENSLILVPLKTRQDEILGVLQLVNAHDPDSGEAIHFHHGLAAFVESLAAQTAVALDNKNLVDQLKQLLDSVVKLIAGAIDAKSPYTGGHCSRVPEIAFLLAKAAGKAEFGPFENFAFSTEDQWREFYIAAWLHDCGKLTIPEYVVDKATKLEALYNRIHEVRTRFELLWRDAEISYYQDLLQDGADEGALRARLEAEQERIREEWAFIAQCNVGGEFMSDERIERVREIGARTWERHLDDGLGLSHEEEKQRQDRPQATLPATETLLADKPEHRFPRTRDPFANGGTKFDMEVPELQNNMGELYNLCIRKGTLNEEERFKIQEHIIQTIVMLNKLPFPENLKRVPEFAGAHHETMDGKGYPRRLHKEEMSLPARMMAVADIFEALTAADRPYNRPKPLGLVLKIMSRMRDDAHIDPDIFDLLLVSGIYKEYAARFMKPEQIEDVDILPLLSEQGRTMYAAQQNA